jgi:O-Antigen ligase
MRSGAITGARAALLGGPAVLAFFSGGYFDEPREWAGLLAWILVVVALALAHRPLAFGPGGRLALVALGGLAVWTLISITWAPIAGDAYHAGQLVVLYAGGLLAAAVLLRGSRTQRAVVPALAVGTLAVVGYGISERLLPGVLHFSHSISAQGRLEQPLTYWNAMGEVAAIGFVLCVSLAGSGARPAWLRAIAAAATAPLGMGLYLSFSRGAVFACVAGLVALVTLAPRREQLRSIGVAIVAGGVASAVAASLHGVASLGGTLPTREHQGLIALLALLAIGLLSAVAQMRLARRERTGELRLPRRAPLIALVAICAGLALAIVVGAKESSRQPLSAGATRYVTLQSNRYDYWQVALRAFGDEPLRGIGAGGWAVYWLRYRHIKEAARDAHSLPLQTLAELGLVGFLLLLAFVGGVARVAHEALARAPALAAGQTAGFIVWLAHAPLDWDWEMPAVTLIAIALAGALIGLAGTPPITLVGMVPRPPR